MCFFVVVCLFVVSSLFLSDFFLLVHTFAWVCNRELEHTNIVRLLGQCIETTPFLMVMESAAYVSCFYSLMFLFAWEDFEEML